MIGRSAEEIDVEDRVVRILQQHRSETNVKFDNITAVLSDLGKAITRLATVSAQMEERHLRHDDSMKAVVKDVDDHEARIRVLEGTTLQAITTAKASVKTITIVSGLIATLVSLVFSALGFLI